jgi:hypothetical protein
MDVVYCPVASFQFFVAGDTAWVEYLLGHSPGITPFFRVMPITHGYLSFRSKVKYAQGQHISRTAAGSLQLDIEHFVLFIGITYWW